MLKTTKRITITGNSEIDGTPVVYMSASLSTEGDPGANINTTIQNQALYISHKEDCRKDVSEFTKVVQNVEDELMITENPEVE